MFPTKKHLTMARSLGVAMVVAMGLASCATYDDDFARVNSRLDTLDTRVQDAAQNAAAANEAAQRANTRLDQLEGRVQQIEGSTGRVPRG
jgi:murein lipoprotein